MKDSSQKSMIQTLKSQAVLQATFEVVGEQRAEIIKRARAKLVAMGVAVSDEDFGPEPAPERLQAP